VIWGQHFGPATRCVVVSRSLIRFRGATGRADATLRHTHAFAAVQD
jgi:hypothetical protein